MNTQTQTQEAAKAINELLASWHRTSNHQQQLQKIRDNLQAPQPIAADAEQKSAGVWVKAIERMPDIKTDPSQIVFRNIKTKKVLDVYSYWTDTHLELNDADIKSQAIGTLVPKCDIEWLDECATQPKGAGVDFDPKTKSVLRSCIEAAIKKAKLSAAIIPVIEIYKIVNYLDQLSDISSLPSQEGQTGCPFDEILK